MANAINLINKIKQNYSHILELSLFLAMPILIFLIYILPPFFILGASRMDSADEKIILFSALSILVWGLFFKYRKRFVLKVSLCRICLSPRQRNVFEFLSWLLIIIPTICLWIQAENLPMWVALKGGSPWDIYSARLNWDLAKSGWIVVPLYAYIITTSAIMPFWILLRFKENSYLQWVLLVLASLILVVGFSKTAFFKVAFPTFFYFVFKRKFKEMASIGAFTVVLFLIVSFVYNSGVRKILDGGASGLTNSSAVETKGSEYPRNGHNESDRNFVFGDNGLAGIANRIIWIPYVTAKHWLNYYELKKLTEKQPIITNRTIAHMFSTEYVPLESFIFNYQFGFEESEIRGVANTSYFIDAWVKYGWVGFIIIITLAPFFFYLTVGNYSPENRGLLLYSVMMLIGNGLLNTLLAGGGLILLAALFTFDFNKENKSSLY